MKDCPFCGSNELRVSHGSWNHQLYPFILCTNCGIKFEKGWTKIELLDAWNKRKDGYKAFIDASVLVRLLAGICIEFLEDDETAKEDIKRYDEEFDKLRKKHYKDWL